MKRTASANVDRFNMDRGPSPNAAARSKDFNAMRNFRTAMPYGSNFAPETDSKSKNILAWAGRVKELIGTYDHGHDARMSQLTRATGYSDLLAACSADDSGDVQSKMTSPIKSDPKPTIVEANFGPTKTPATGTSMQRKPEKELASRSADQTRQPPSMLSPPPHEARRASHSQDRGRTDHSDTSQKPASRRASQSEVKPSAVREVSRSPDARSLSRRSPAPDKPSSVAERVSSAESMRRVAEQKESKESVETASQRSNDFAVKRRTQQSLPTRLQRDLPSSQRTSDPSLAPDNSGRDSRDKREREPTSPSRSRRPTLTNSDCDEQHQSGRRPTAQSDEETPAQPKPVPVRNARQHATDEKVERHSDKVVWDGSRGASLSGSVTRSMNSDESVERPAPLPQNNSTENRHNCRKPTRARRVPDLADSNPSDDQQRTRGAQAAARSSRTPTPDVEPVNSRPVRARMSVDRSSERRKPTYTSAEGDSSSESLLQMESDVDVKRRAERARRPEKPNASKELLRRKVRELERYKQELRALADNFEEKRSVESISQKLINLGTRRRAEFPVPARPRRASPPSQSIPDTSSALRDYQESSTPVRSRRRLRSENGVGVNELRPEARDLSPPTSIKPRTPSADPPCLRPILRNTSAHAARELTTAAQKGSAVVPAVLNRPHPSPHYPALHARPAVALKRPPAAFDDDNDDTSVSRRHTGRGLGKVAAVTDLSDDRGSVGLSVVPPPANRHLEAEDDLDIPIKASPTTSLRPTSTGLTPRRMWHILHPLMLRLYQLLILIVNHVNLMLHELSSLPEVAATCHRMCKIGQGIMDSWALLFAVVAAFSCVFMVVILS